MNAPDFSFELTYLASERIVRITTAGRFDFSANQKIVKAGLEAGRRFGTHLFLVDHRQTQILLRSGDIPVASKVNFILGLNYALRRAFLFDPAVPSHAVIEQYVALNNSLGLTSKAFVDEQAAVAWLLADPAQPAAPGD